MFATWWRPLWIQVNPTTPAERSIPKLLDPAKTKSVLDMIVRLRTFRGSTKNGHFCQPVITWPLKVVPSLCPCDCQSKQFQTRRIQRKQPEMQVPKHCKSQGWGPRQGCGETPMQPDHPKSWRGRGDPMTLQSWKPVVHVAPNCYGNFRFGKNSILSPHPFISLLWTRVGWHEAENHEPLTLNLREMNAVGHDQRPKGIIPPQHPLVVELYNSIDHS